MVEESFVIILANFTLVLVKPLVSVVPSISRVSPVDDFGEDKDLCNLLKTLHPKPFSGKGTDVPKILKE